MTNIDPHQVKERFRDGKVAVAGLGGLGSNIAVMLARSGVGKLLLTDFDRVEESNLNRQYYDRSHLGMLKTDALKTQINKINPSVDVETCAAKVTEENVREIFKNYSIVCEAFDDPKYKAILVNALLDGQRKIIAASGMAGFGSANKIKTKHTFKDMYICGDSEPAAPGGSFMAPRVAVCAGHQANMVLRLLLNIEEE
ncbi:MAG: sulfur carrier protein ThiS adenylyltransferase ThiF [Methanomassiliicoccaceae archaeon]|nr:sulfur carrier protein ThiS adenylyltransferase ThiF [Methanomassiliicoccaceae archaeon]